MVKMDWEKANKARNLKHPDYKFTKLERMADRILAADEERRRKGAKRQRSKNTTIEVWAD